MMPEAAPATDTFIRRQCFLADTASSVHGEKEEVYTSGPGKCKRHSEGIPSVTDPEFPITAHFTVAIVFILTSLVAYVCEEGACQLSLSDSACECVRRASEWSRCRVAKSALAKGLLSASVRPSGTLASLAAPLQHGHRIEH